MKRLIPGGVFALALGAVLAGCADEAPSGEPAETLEQRRTARQDVCLRETLLETAVDELVTLEQTFGGSDVPEVLRRTQAAAIEFKRAYVQQAELRLLAAARIDSAYNYARERADSVRYVEQAQNFISTAPTPGSVEANALDSYRADLTTLAADPDHLCNWAVDPIEEGG